MKTITNHLVIISLLTLFVSCDYIKHIEHRAAVINKYEVVALNLAHKNQLLESEIVKLKFEMEQLKTENNFLKIQINKDKGRTLASVEPVSSNDLVGQKVYKWKPDQLMAMAETEFDKKNFEKSAQFFMTFMRNFPEDQRVNDQFLFQTGLAAFESGKHHDWTMEAMGKLIEKYPTSPYFRGAKLWTALTELKLGKKDKFFNTVEEFRHKYRNTPEWKILSAHYEEILQKYKN